ncbi:MAG: helix-turn-helix transcriptional regulator [Thermomicrobiales bacterium]
MVAHSATVAAVTPALAGLPETRREMLGYLKRTGEASTERLSEITGITPSGARQHLTALEQDGFITHRNDRDGRGRPRKIYRLTPAGDSLFPRAYVELTNELLEYVEDEDPEMLERIFDRRGMRRLERAKLRTQDLSFAGRVAEVAKILDEDGYLADFVAQDDGSYLIREHNCAVLAVAERYGHACSSELTFLQELLPDADVTRVAHRIAGGHVCAYHVLAKTEGAHAE